MKGEACLHDDLTATRHEHLRLTAPAVQHEINNAMMVLASNLELLARSVAEGAPRRQLDRSIEASKRLEETIRGFLDAARRPVSDAQKVSLGLAVKHALPLLKVALGARHGIDLAPHGPVAEARIDRAALDLALLALVRDVCARMQPGARIGLAVAERGDEVTLAITLPPGVEPGREVAALLAGAGRLEAGPLLAWPKG